jgi:hypothetical protein
MLKFSMLTKCPILYAILSLCCNYSTTGILGVIRIDIVSMYEWKMPEKYEDMVSSFSGPLGLLTR